MTQLQDVYLTQEAFDKALDYQNTLERWQTELTMVTDQVEALIDKRDYHGLSPHETQELQRLMTAKAAIFSDITRLKVKALPFQG